MGDSEKNLADGKLSDDIIVEDVAVKTARKAPKSRQSQENIQQERIFLTG